MDYESIDGQANANLSFATQLSTLKNTLVLWDDLVTKTTRLSSALRTVLQCIAGFLEAFQKVADSAFSSNCGLRELGGIMTRFCLRERGLESRLRTFNSQLSDCLAAPLSDRLDEWRRTVAQLDRESSKDWRRARAALQRSTTEVLKATKRTKRKGFLLPKSDAIGPVSAYQPVNGGGLSSHDHESETSNAMLLNLLQQDVSLKQRSLAELERVNLRRTIVEERRRYCELMTCLKPVLETQAALFNDVGWFDQTLEGFAEHATPDLPTELSPELEQAIDQAVVRITSSVVSNAVSVTTGNADGSESRVSLRWIKGASSFRFHRTNSVASSSTSSNAVDSNSLGGGSQFDLSSVLQSQLSLDSNSRWRQSLGMLTNGGSSAGHQPPASAISSMPSSSIAPPPPSASSAAVSDCLSLFDPSIDSSSMTYFDPAMIARQAVALANAKRSIDDDYHDDDDQPLPPPPQLDHSYDDDHATTFVQNDQPGSSNANNNNNQTTGSTDDGTTEDDDETEDDERGGPLRNPNSMLYPNQAIPPPVYTNLSELKKAAALKFGQQQHHSTAGDAPKSPPPKIDQRKSSLPDLGAVGGAAGVENGSGKGTNHHHQPANHHHSGRIIPPPPSDYQSTNAVRTCASNDDGAPTRQFATVNAHPVSGMSTFRRRRANGTGKTTSTNGVNGGDDGSSHYDTPSSSSTGIQYSNDDASRNRRCSTIRPPRRSSSVSRDYRLSTIDPSPSCLNGNPATNGTLAFNPVQQQSNRLAQAAATVNSNNNAAFYAPTQSNANSSLLHQRHAASSMLLLPQSTAPGGYADPSQLLVGRPSRLLQARSRPQMPPLASQSFNYHHQQQDYSAAQSFTPPPPQMFASSNGGNNPPQAAAHHQQQKCIGGIKVLPSHLSVANNPTFQLRAPGPDFRHQQSQHMPPHGHQQQLPPGGGYAPPNGGNLMLYPGQPIPTNGQLQYNASSVAATNNHQGSSEGLTSFIE